MLGNVSDGRAIEPIIMLQIDDMERPHCLRPQEFTFHCRIIPNPHENELEL